MSKKVISLLLVICMMFGVMLFTGITASAEEKMKVGFVFVGPKNDGGWTQAHYNGMMFMKNKLGVEVAYRETVSEQGPDAKNAITGLIDQGCKVIFTTSFGFMDATLEVAKEFPDVKFYHCSGYKTNDNMSTYFGKMQEPRFLSGLVAGLKTKANKIGYVAAMNIPEVVAGINAFTLGVQTVNPKAIVKVRWTNTWIDEAKEKEAADALLAVGCDVITQHNDSTAPQVAAQKKGAFAIGYDLDTPKAAPKAYMTAPIWNWGPYYVSEVKSVIDGKYKSTQYYGGMKTGTVSLAPLTSVAPTKSKTLVEQYKAKILAGTFNVFQGPIYSLDGKLWVKKGSKLTDGEVLGMTKFVKGVEVSLK
jgi:basic membrane protein A